jgi:hypothetical protein
VQGFKIGKSKRGDKLDALLARNDVSGKALRTIYDEYNDEEIVLSKEELKMIMRVRKGQFPHVEVRLVLFAVLLSVVESWWEAWQSVMLDRHPPPLYASGVTRT